MVNTAWAPLVIVVGDYSVGWLAARVFLPQPLRRGLAGRLPLVGTGLAGDVARRVLPFAGLAPGKPVTVARSAPADG